jgi:5-methylthioadenosine/S-adenosylhomocysteine deaminase
VSLLIRRAVLDGVPSTIRIRHGRIESIEPDDPSSPPATAGRVIDARGLHAFPSFRNGHTHAAMVLFRGYGDDMPLMDWLSTRIWPAERHLTEEDVYLGTRLGILEMIRGGTTFFNEMYWHRPGVVRAVEEMGIHGLIGVTVIDLGDPVVLARQKEEVEELVRRRRSALALQDQLGTNRVKDLIDTRRLDDLPDVAPRSTATQTRLAGARESEAPGGAGRNPARAFGTRGVAELALAPHSIYTVTPEVLAWLGDLARQEDLLLHIHLSETAGEVEDCLRAVGCRPAQHLQRLGLVGPNLIAAHGQYLDDAELALLGDACATVVTNPTANLKLATGGIFPYRRARAAGVRVCLGTDGAASNNNLDMLEEMKIAALVQKHADRDATSLPVAEALAMATTSPSEAFRLGSGRIEVGARADLILVDFSGPSTQPLHDPVSALVYAATAANVHTTICEGRVLMHAGTVEVCDEREVIESAVEAARRSIGRSRSG